MYDKSAPYIVNQHPDLSTHDIPLTMPAPEQDPADKREWEGTRDCIGNMVVVAERPVNTNKFGMVEMVLNSREPDRGMIADHEVRGGTRLLLPGKGEVPDQVKIGAPSRPCLIDPPARG